MSEVIDIYEKYANLFRLKVEPRIDFLYKIPADECKLYPVTRTGDGVGYYLVGKATYDKVQPYPNTVKSIIKRVVCEKISTNPELRLNKFETKIINQKGALKKYGEKVVAVYPGCNFRVYRINDEFYLTIDYTISIRNFLKAHEIIYLLPSFDFNRFNRGYYEVEGEWNPGRIEKIKGQEVDVLTDEGTAIKVPTHKFLPDVPSFKISTLLKKKGIYTNFDQEIKRLSLLTVDNPPQQRLQKITDIAKSLQENVFPIEIGPYKIDLDPSPLRLMAPKFEVRENLVEPFSAFDHEDTSKRSQKIFDGLVTFGSYDKPKKDLKIVILSTKDQSDKMAELVDKINSGSYRYSGMAKTFGTTLKIMETLETDNFETYVDECKKFSKKTDWEEADLFLVYVPEELGKASYDSPYYEVKKFLLKIGIPSQMVDEETLGDPKFKDLNLALNIFAKTGNTPWVLDSELNNVDLFIGMSYSQIKRRGLVERMMGYVNVFDKFGRWKFYQGDIEAFPYEERQKHYKNIIKDSILKYKAENPDEEIKKIQIHYTQKYSKHDRKIIYDCVKELIPDCEVTFVWINLHTPMRFFDKTTKDGSMLRGTYVFTPSEKNQFLLSTTGINPYNQFGMGTPKILQVNVKKAPQDEPVNIDEAAQHILSLTRLNWASSKDFCHEPITTKYAGDIAKLMNIFMEDKEFSISERVKNKPWFL